VRKSETATHQATSPRHGLSPGMLCEQGSQIVSPTDRSDWGLDHIPLPKRVRRGAESLERTYSGSSAEHLWNRLTAMDFINKGMLFAAVLLLCFFPFIIVANALAGQSAVTGLVRHLALNQEAARDVSGLFASSSSTSNAVTGTAYLFFILGGIAAASGVQDLYERSFELQAGGLKDIGRRFVWLVVTVAWVSLAAVAGPWLRNAVGLWLVGILAFVGLTLFWWGTMWFLLSGRVPWRALLPSAVATALFWVGMEAVFSFIFSGTVISDDKKYGPIGVVFALMSWLIAIGVVIILGAVVGLVWRERDLSFSRAYHWLMPSGRKTGGRSLSLEEDGAKERAP
jgi:membrane protein